MRTRKQAQSGKNAFSWTTKPKPIDDQQQQQAYQWSDGRENPYDAQFPALGNSQRKDIREQPKHTYDWNNKGAAKNNTAGGYSGANSYSAAAKNGAENAVQQQQHQRAQQAQQISGAVRLCYECFSCVCVCVCVCV